MTFASFGLRRVAGSSAPAKPPTWPRSEICIPIRNLIDSPPQSQLEPAQCFRPNRFPNSPSARAAPHSPAHSATTPASWPI